jgi:hypothetical protein
LTAAHDVLQRYDPDLSRPDTERRFAAFREHSRSLRGHLPASPYCGPALLVDADPGVRGLRDSDGWRPYLAGPVRQLTLDADHYGLVSAAAASNTAAAIRQALRDEA